MKILRSPDDAIDGLAGYPTERRRVEIPAGDGGSRSRSSTLRVHFVDTNPDADSVVVVLHGNPSWSWIWRRQVEAAVAAGYRAIAPDLVGMGMSDKPSELTDYTVAGHVEWMRALLVDELGLS
ncbi:MAG: alpha/beta fold hydrolase, partial [Acidimicrobiales bacterium]